MKPVVLIGHDPVETFGLALPSLEAAGLEPLLHRSNLAGSTLPDVGDVAAVIVFGGEMNVDMLDEHPFLADERTLVRHALKEEVPFLGICLGAQLLARALDVPVFPAPVREIGFSVLHPTKEAAEDPLLSVFADGDMVFHWHEDTFNLPPDATLLGTGDRVRVQAFRHGNRAWGLQFHLEVERTELDLWLDSAGRGLEERWGKSAEQIAAEARLHLATQELRASELFRRFAAVVREG